MTLQDGPGRSCSRGPSPPPTDRRQSWPSALSSAGKAPEPVGGGQRQLCRPATRSPPRPAGPPPARSPAARAGRSRPVRAGRRRSRASRAACAAHGPGRSGRWPGARLRGIRKHRQFRDDFLGGPSEVERDEVQTRDTFGEQSPGKQDRLLDTERAMVFIVVTGISAGMIGVVRNHPAQRQRPRTRR